MIEKDAEGAQVENSQLKEQMRTFVKTKDQYEARITELEDEIDELT